MNSGNINSFNNYNSDGGNPQMSASDRFKSAWNNVPIFVKIVIILTITFYILSWPFTRFIMYFTNIPLFTMFSFHIWRLVTSVFATLNILNIIFAFISWIPEAIRLETTTGTVKYMINFLINSTLINIIYVIVMIIISLYDKAVLSNPSAGLWPLIMAEITLLCLANPDNQVSFFFLPCQFSAKFYPWALFAFFTLMNGNLQMDILSGIGYGYLYYFYLRHKLQFSNEFIQNLENRFIFNQLAKFNGFIKLQQTQLNSGFTIMNNRSDNNTSRPDQPKQHPVTTPFKGKGTVVGTNNDDRLDINDSMIKVDSSTIIDKKNKTKQDNKYHEINDEI